MPAGTPLGDPIELGATAAVMAEASSASSPLALLAAKSWCGHSEPAAGVLGLAHAHMAISQQAVLPVTHLRALNPHIQSTFSTHGSDRRKLVAARQLAPMADANLGAALLCGTSAFAFQGTNAHAIMSVKPAAEAAARSTGQKAVALPFQQKRFWVAPLLHPLLNTFKPQHDQHSVVVFEANLAVPSAAYLWDHMVAGQSLMPGAGTFDLAWSAARLLTASGHTSSTMLVESTLPAPLLLPQQAAVPGSFAVQVSINTGSSQVQVTTAGQQQTHLIGSLRQHQAEVTVLKPSTQQMCLAKVLYQDEAQLTVEDQGMVSGDLAWPGDSSVSKAALPAQLDCAFQLGAALTQGRQGDHSDLRVPVGAQAVNITPSQQDLSLPLTVTACMHSVQSMPEDGSVRLDFTVGQLCNVSELKAKPLQASKTDISAPQSAPESMLYVMSRPALEPVQAAQQSASSLVHSIRLHSSDMVAVYAKALAAAKSAAAASENGKQTSFVLRTVGALSALTAQPAPCSSSNHVLLGLRALLKTLGHEVPKMQCEAMDRHAAHLNQSTAGTAAAITISNGGAQHAQRGSAEQAGVMHASRLLPLAAANSPVQAGPYQLMPCPRGSLANLTPMSLPPMIPKRGQVLVEVHAVGVNFRDVLNVLGMYPGDPGPPGADCAGVVTAIGAGVHGFVKGKLAVQSSLWIDSAVV